MRNELHRHKKSDKIKWIAVFAAIILLAVSVTAAMTKGFNDWNPYGWFDKKEEQNISVSKAISNTSVQMEIPSLRADVSARANSNYTEFEFTGEIEVLGVVDYNNAKALHVNIPYEFVLDAHSPWILVDINITAELNGKSVGRYTKNIPYGTKETVTYVPLSDIGDFTEYGTYTFSVLTYYELVIMTQDGEYATAQFTYEHKDITSPLPEPPTKEGHTFAGWYYGNGVDCDNSCTAYDNDYIMEDTDLHAHFEINVYTITFDSNGGELLTSISADYNSTPELPTPIRTGYNFIGWTLPSGLDYDSASPLKGNLTLIAKWEIRTFTVTFVVDGETYHTLSVPYGTKLTDAIAEARLKLNVKSVVQNDGLPIDTNMDKLSVTADMTAEADIQTTAQKVVTSWWKLLIGAVLGIGLLAFICCIPSMIKGGKKRRNRV